MKRKNLLRITGSIALLLSIANITQTNVDKIDASNELAIENDLNALINSYYNNGVYLKETIINLNTDAVNELNQHGGFHADADDLVRITQFNGDTLTMTIPGNDTYESNYGTDSETGALTHWGKGGTPKVVITKPTSAETAGNWKNWEEDGMEGYYWTLKDIVAVDTQAWSLNNGVYSSSDETVIEWFKAVVAPCYVGFTTSTGNYITLSSVEIEEVDNTLQLRLFSSEGDATKLTNDNLVFAQATISQEHTYHVYDSNHECVFCGDIVLTQIGSHTGTSQWDMAASEKLATNGIFHQNVSNVAKNGDDLADFSLQIQYRGWENNGERTYFYTIKSVGGVLTIDNQLGIAPWSYTTFNLNEEHKARLASEEGLDFVVKFDKENQTMKLYIYTAHELVELHTLNTYYNGMDNFYRLKFVLTGEATVETKVYNSYDSEISAIFNELKLELIEHEYVDVEATNATCTTDGVVAHKECIMCGLKVDADSIPMTGHTYVDGVCSVCDKVSPFTALSSHSGTSQWDMAASEKLATNGIFHQNISNVAKNGDDLADFSLQIQYRGWENNGERTYFYTIKSVGGVLTIDNQLGIDPWSYTTFTLSEEHKARLASEKGLDFYVQYDHNNQKLSLYIVTDGRVELLHTLNTYYGSMANFYKFKYTLTGTATVNTYTYTISDNFDAASDLKNL